MEVPDSLEQMASCITVSSSGSESDDSDIEMVDCGTLNEKIKPFHTESIMDEITPKLLTSDAVNFKQCTITKVKNESDLDGIKIVSVTSLLNQAEFGLNTGDGKNGREGCKGVEKVDSENDSDFIVNPKNNITVRTEDTNADNEIRASDPQLKKRFIANPKRSFTVRTEIKTSSNVLSTTTSFNDNKVETCSTVSSPGVKESSEAPQVTVFKTKITNTNTKESTPHKDKQLFLSTKKYAKLTRLEPLESKDERKSEGTDQAEIVKLVSARKSLGKRKRSLSEEKENDGSVEVGVSSVVESTRKSSAEKRKRNRSEEREMDDSVEIKDSSNSDSDIEEVKIIPVMDPLQSRSVVDSTSECEDQLGNAEVTVISDSDSSRPTEGPSNVRFYTNPDEVLARVKKIVLRAGFGSEGKMVVKRIERYYEAIRNDIVVNSEDVKKLDSLAWKTQKAFNTKKPAEQIAESVKEVISFLKAKSVKEDRKLNHLYKLYKKVEERIKTLEAKEVESDSDESRNSYVILSKYKAKAIKVYTEICKIEKITTTAGRAYLEKFNYSGKGPRFVQKALEKYFNKTRKFPNFSDVLKLINKVNSTEKLKMSSIDIRSMAENVFVDFGQKLQQHRVKDDRLLFNDYLTEMGTDPALSDPELARKLTENKRLRKKEEDVLDYYVRKQMSRGTENEEEKDLGSDECYSQDDGSDCEESDHNGLNCSEDEEKVVAIYSDDSSASDVCESGPKKKAKS